MSQNWEINRKLVASFLFDLSNHNSLQAIIKIINIILLKTKFLLILNSHNFNQSNNIVHVKNTRIRLYIIYKYYAHHDFILDKISIYEYIQFVSIMNQSQEQSTNDKLDNAYRQKKTLFVYHHKMFTYWLLFFDAEICWKMRRMKMKFLDSTWKYMSIGQI